MYPYYHTDFRPLARIKRVSRKHLQTHVLQHEHTPSTAQRKSKLASSTPLSHGDDAASVSGLSISRFIHSALSSEGVARSDTERVSKRRQNREEHRDSRKGTKGGTRKDTRARKRLRLGEFRA